MKKQHKYCAWMLRRDGRAFPGYSFFPYADSEYGDDVFDMVGKWLYGATQSEETKQLILNLVFAINTGLKEWNEKLPPNELREKPWIFAKRFLWIHKQEIKYVDPKRTQELGKSVLYALHEEFLLVNLRETPDDPERKLDLWFQVSEWDPSWLPVIYDFAKKSEAYTFTVQWNVIDTKREDFLPDEQGRILKQILTEELRK